MTYRSLDILKTHFIVRIGFCTILCVLSIDRQEMRVLFEFCNFFNSVFQRFFAKNFDRGVSDCITLQTAFAQMESKRKAFWFSEGRTKV